MIHLTSRTLLLVATLSVILGGSTMARATEEPAYEVLATLEEVEVRRYGPSIQAITAMPASTGRNSGFRRLAGYIFGGNDQDTEIAMTAPVATWATDDQAEMAFTMPAEWTMDTLPEPEDETVTLREVPAYTAAVIAFSGRATNGKVAEMEKQLLQRLVEEGIEYQGSPILNRYDPPWQLPFLRRNEVAIRILWPGGD